MKRACLSYWFTLNILVAPAQEGYSGLLDSLYNGQETITGTGPYLPRYREVFDGTHFGGLDDILRWDKKDWKKAIDQLYSHDEAEAYALAFGLAAEVGVDVSDMDGMLSDLAAWGEAPVGPLEGPLVQAYLAQGGAMKKKWEALYKAILPKSGLAIPVWDNVLGAKIKNKTAEENARLLVRHVLDLAKNKDIRRDVLATLLNQAAIKEKKKLAHVLRQLPFAATQWEFLQAAMLQAPEAGLGHAPMLQGLYRNGDVPTAGEGLFGALNVLGAESPVPATTAVLNAKARESMHHRAVLEDMALKRQKLLAKIYNQLADRQLEKAASLGARVGQDGFFEMTAAERLQVHRLIGSYQLGAIRLKQRAGHLLETAATRVSPEQQATATYYQNLKARRLARTPSVK